MAKFFDVLLGAFKRPSGQTVPEILAAGANTGQQAATISMYRVGSENSNFEAYAQSQLSRKKQEDMLRKSPSAKAICRRTALYCSTVPLTFHTHKTGTTRYKDATGHVINRFLKRPNNFQTPSDLVFDMVFNLMWYEQVYIVFEENPDVNTKTRFPFVMFAISPSLMEAVRLKGGEIVYKFEINGKKMTLKANQVLDINFKHVTSDLYSVGLADTLYSDHVIETFARRQVGQYYANGTNFAGVISFEKELNDGESAKIRKELTETTKDGAFRVMLLANGAKWNNVVSGNVETNTVPVLNEVSRSFAMVTGFPLGLLNAETGNPDLERLFWSQLGGPLLTKIEQAIDQKIGFGINDNFHIIFDRSKIEVLLQMKMEQARIDVAQQTTGLRTPDEIREQSTYGDYGDDDALAALAGHPDLEKIKQLMKAFGSLPQPVFEALQTEKQMELQLAQAAQAAANKPSAGGRPKSKTSNSEVATPSLPVAGTSSSRNQGVNGEAQMIDTSGEKEFDLTEDQVAKTLSDLLLS